MRVATHSGPFHADDVFAIAILSLIHDDLEVVRTRDPSVFNDADMRVDIGQRYDHETKDYDHHQKEGAGERTNEIPYAAAGLIWKHYGMELVTSREAWERVDSKLLMPIDANDNGVSIFEDPKLYPYTVNDVLRLFNPGWQDESNDFDEGFAQAVELAKFILGGEIGRAEAILKARAIVMDAIEKSDGKILILDQFVPWKKTAVEESQAIYAIYESFDGTWRCHAIPTEEDNYDVRKDLPDAWGGLEGEKLAEVSGVDDAIFCHRKLFLCGAKSKEGALEFAQKALER